MDAEKPEQWFSNEAATFGDRLSAARETAGLSQEELAARLGVRMTTLQAWRMTARSRAGTVCRCWRGC